MKKARALADLIDKCPQCLSVQNCLLRCKYLHRSNDEFFRDTRTSFVMTTSHHRRDCTYGRYSQGSLLQNGLLVGWIPTLGVDAIGFLPSTQLTEADILKSKFVRVHSKLPRLYFAFESNNPTYTMYCQMSQNHAGLEKLTN